MPDPYGKRESYSTQRFYWKGQKKSTPASRRKSTFVQVTGEGEEKKDEEGEAHAHEGATSIEPKVASAMRVAMLEKIMVTTITVRLYAAALAAVRITHAPASPTCSPTPAACSSPLRSIATILSTVITLKAVPSGEPSKDRPQSRRLPSQADTGSDTARVRLRAIAPTHKLSS